MAARFPCIMTVQMMGAVPVTTGSTVTVIYDRRTPIMDRIVILISRFYDMFSWGESRPLIFWTCPTVRPFDSTYISTDKSDFHNSYKEISAYRDLYSGPLFAERVRLFRPFTPVEPR